MKKTKRIFSLLLAMALLLACIPQIPLMAKAATVASGKCGDNLTWTLDDAGTLTISGNGAMKNYANYDSAPWYSKRSSVKEVVIGNSVTTIGDYAFGYCTSLTSVTIGNSVTTIGDYAFYDCDGLTSVTIPDSVITIGDYAFAYFDGLTSVTIPDSVITIGDWAFSVCSKLTSVTIPDSVTTIGQYAFGSCSSLTEIEVDPNNESYCDIKGVLFSKDKKTLLCYPRGKSGAYSVPDSVTTIRDYAFSNCTRLTSVIIPDSVTTIGNYAFRYCDGLTSVTIGNSVETIGYDAFNYTAWYDAQPAGLVYAGKVAYKYKGTCPREVVIKEGTLGIAGSAFYNCDGLTRVTIPDSVTTIGDYAFYDCNKLTSVTIGNSVTTIGDYAFYHCYKLTSVTIPDSVTTIGKYAFYDCSVLTSVTIGNSVETIGDYAFYKCTGLTSVTIPHSVITIGDYAFYYCYNLTSVTIGNSVTTIGDYAFYDCDGLTSVTIPDSVITIGERAFSSCHGLTSVTIPDFVTTIGDHAFSSCSKLTSVTIGNSVTTIGECAFYGCDGLTSVTIPNSVTTIGKQAFSSCSKLTSVTIGNSVETIWRHAFSSCSSLTKVEVDPNNENYSDIKGVLFSKDQKTLVYYPEGKSGAYSVPDSVTTIGKEAFYYCDGLTSVTIGNSVTTIGSSAFYDCDGLTSVTIGNSVTTIRDDAFSQCSKLTEIYFDGSAPTIGSTAFGNVTATAYYYPDDTWTSSVKKNYGGTITWVARECPHSYSSIVTPPTCTEQGYTTHTCSKCGDSYKDTYVKENGHTYGKWEKVDETNHKRTCTVCEAHTETASHTWGTGVVTKAATCKDTGIMTYTCSACNATKTETLPKTSDHSYTSVVTPPTCTEQGYTTHTCSVCGNSYKDTYVKENGHSYGKWEQMDKTYHKHTCTVCKTHSETAEHTPSEWIIDRAATCKQVGSQHQECADCGATLQTAEIPLADHRYESEVTKAATCTEDGIITNTCTVCGHSYTVVVRAEHNYQPTDRKEATCTEDGYITYTCSKCGDHYNEVITAGHKYVATITKVATATQDGEITYTCSVCGHSYTEVIPARKEAKVLLIQDTNPWQENNNVKLLNQMVKDGYLDGWDMVTTQFDADDLAGYSVILIANDQHSGTYSNLQQRQELLIQFAQAGGTVVYGACDQGWANGDINYMLPGGVTSSNYYSHYNYIVNGGHPIVTGAATDGKALTDTLLYGNFCSHTAFGNLPEDAVVILQDGNGNATLVEYAMGEGHIILSGLTWEFYYTRGAYGGGDTTYTRNVYDDLVLYALQRGDSCVHVYEETKTVEPTCETNGYTVYTCKDCGAVKTVTTADKLGHTYGAWEQVDEAYHKHTCTVCKTHTETKKHTFGEDRVCTDCGYKAYTVGDFDGDGLVTDADVIWLLWHTVFPEDYPLNQSGDIDGDGYVTDADVIYLLWHTVFPEDYPLE